MVFIPIPYLSKKQPVFDYEDTFERRYKGQNHLLIDFALCTLYLLPTLINYFALLRSQLPWQLRLRRKMLLPGLSH